MNEKLLEHVRKNLVYYKNVSRETMEQISNLSSGHYLCFDTESCRDEKDNEKERVWCWSLSSTLDDLVIYGYSLEEFFIFMSSLYNYKDFDFRRKTKAKNINIKIWVHNLAWDCEFLKYMLAENDFKYYSKIMYDDNSVEDEFLDCNCWNVTENNGQVYNATIQLKMPDLKFKNKKFKSYIKMKFYDSAKLIPVKLDTIGKDIIKIDEMFYKLKDEFDYERIRPYKYEMTEDEKCYIYNDVYILKEFILQYYIANNLKGFTASGIAFNNMLEFLYPDEPKKYEQFEAIFPPLKDRKIIQLVDKSYSGGFTYCNPTHKGKTINKTGHSIDRNSSYPSEMKYGKLPYGKPKYFEGKYKKDKEYDIAIQRVQFDGFKRKNGSNLGFIKIGSNCEFITDLKTLGLKKNDYASSNFDKDGNLITFNYDIVLTTQELEFFQSVYDFYVFRRVGNKILKGSKNLVKGITYVEGAKFKSMIGYLGEYVDDCVLRKNKYKEEGNNCAMNVAKVDMNAIYGKLGSSFLRVIYTYVLDEKGLFNHQRKYISDFEFDYEENRKYYKPYSAFTTSYARLSLMNIIVAIEKKYGADEFLYSDTDSVYATLSIEEFFSLGIDLHKTRLGAWDIEKTFLSFKCLGAKKYILYGKAYGKRKKMKLIAHCAGLPVEEQKALNFENFYLGAVFNKKQKRKVIGGYRLEKTTFELKEFTFYS